MTIDIVEKGKNPHLALTHKDQGYSANKRPVSLLMKKLSIKLTDELIKSLETLGLPEASEIKKSEPDKTLLVQAIIKNKLKQ